MIDFLKGHRFLWGVGITLILCLNSLNYGYYNILDINLELYKPFSLSANVYSSFDLFLVAMPPVIIIFLIVSIWHFLSYILRKVIFKTRIIRKSPSVMPIFHALTQNKDYLRRLHQQNIKPSTKNYITRIFINRDTFLFAIITILVFAQLDKGRTFPSSLEVLFLFYITHYNLNHVFVLFVNKRIIKSTKTLLIPIFFILHFYIVGFKVGVNLESQEYVSKFTPISFNYNKKLIQSDSSFTLIFQSNDMLIMRKHTSNSNYYFERSSVKNYVTGEQVEIKKKGH